MSIDYDRYAAAEAELAWLNRTYELTGRFALDSWALAVLAELSSLCPEAGMVIGHAKLTVVAGDVLVKARLTAAGGSPFLDVAADGGPVERARAVLNARVVCTPEELDALTSRAIAAALAPTAVGAKALDGESFQPSYPRPVHRMAASG